MCHCSPSPRRPLSGHRGFTLIELLVVMAIIGVLVGLMIPAVQGIRETARQTTCCNNLRELARGLLAYHESARKFPPAINITDPETGAAAGEPRRRTWTTDILPFIDAKAIYDRFDPTKPLSDPANLKCRSTQLPLMICPSDDSGNQTTQCSQDGGSWARGNYAANAHQAAPNDKDATVKERKRRGVFGRNESLPVDRILDGAGTTILLLEIRAGVHPLDRRGTWAMGLCGSNSLWQHASNGVLRPNSCTGTEDKLIDCSGLTTQATAAFLTQKCMACDTSQSTAIQGAARGPHSGGIYVVMADSTTRFISNNIDTGNQPVGSFSTAEADLGVWQRLNLAQDGLTLDESKF